MSALFSWLVGGDLGADGSLAWIAPTWVVVLGVVGALLAWAVSWVGERSVGARALEALLFGAALLGLVVALSRPIWVEESGRVEAGRVAVLVDASASMGILEDGTARHHQATAALEHVLAELPDAEVYHFGEDLRVGAPASFELPSTDLEGALNAIEERYTGEQLGAVVVITDGLDRGPLRKRFAAEVDATPPTLLGPLTLYQVGNPAELLDLAVRSIDTGGYAFLRNSFHLKANIQGTGFAGQKVPVTLLQDGAPVTVKTVTLDEDGRAVADFEVIPQAAGRFAYEVTVPTYEHDAVPANNALPVVVRVVRDRIRVLQVAGSPSWDVKFLRRFLKGDPSVDLVSFFILRTGRDMQARYRDTELSLIAFPYTDLFSTDLWSFDVVIFQNFDYQPYFNRRSYTLLDNLRRYVAEDGHAVVMVGGDRSFGLGDYQNTPLAEVLPVEVTNAERPTEIRFRPALTESGARHPVTRLVVDGGENQGWWGRLSEMDGSNVVVRAKPDATVLLQHPTLTDADGKPLPVLSVREAGKGRTMALTVDSSWRWSMSEAAAGRGNQAYLRFWKNSLRWLMKDDSVSRVTVDTPRENYAVGDEVRLVVRARGTGFEPLMGAEVVAQVNIGSKQHELKGRTGSDGEAVLTLPAETRGTHKVTAAVRLDGKAVGEAATVYAVTERDPELDEVSPDAVFSQRLVARVGGRFHATGTLGPVLVDPGAGRTVLDRRETPLWRAPLLALWVGALLGLAWIVRRRAGLR